MRRLCRRKSLHMHSSFMVLNFSEMHTHIHYTALLILSGTTRVSRYQKKHSPTHTHHGHQSFLSAFSIYYDPWHPPYSIHVLYSLFPQSSSKFGLPLGLAPTTSYSIHFFTQSLSSFCNTCQYHRNLFCCSTEIMSSTLYSELYLVTTPHIHLTILISKIHEIILVRIKTLTTSNIGCRSWHLLLMTNIVVIKVA